MRNTIARFAATLLAATVFATPALADPIVKVKLDLPNVVIAPAPVVVAPAPVVVHRAAPCPGANYVWVDGSWRRDAYGRSIFVAGHCAYRPGPTVTVVKHTPGKTVIVRR